MRCIAKTGKHIADIDPFIHHFLKPESLGIVLVHQSIRTDICQMIALVIDKTQVRKKRTSLVHYTEDASEISRILQKIRRMRQNCQLEI